VRRLLKQGYRIDHSGMHLFETASVGGETRRGEESVNAKAIKSLPRHFKELAHGLHTKHIYKIFLLNSFLIHLSDWRARQLSPLFKMND